MNDLRERLEARASILVPAPDALESIREVAARRRWRRRGAAGALAALVVGAVAFTGALGTPSRSRPGTPDAASQPPPSHTTDETSAVAVRAQFGIVGPTKGSPGGVVVRTPSAGRRGPISVLEMSSGKRVALPRGTTVVGPGGAVATVAPNQLSVKRSGGRKAVVVRTRARVRQVTWSAGGTALFALVGKEWILVPTGAGAAGGGVSTDRHVTTLHVPSVPGGPTLLSVSPDGTHILLFGTVTASAAEPADTRAFARARPPVRVPRLYVGNFDGATVTAVRAVQIPPGALSGPLGWLGDNAFLVSPGSGQALIVRPGKPSLLVRPTGISIACPTTDASCPPDGPWLLGTNTDGTLLLWRVGGSAAGSAGRGQVAYYATWLNGTHAVRLTGSAGRYGPAVAPR